MIYRRATILAALIAGLFIGTFTACQAANDSDPQVVASQEALSPCNETVPANRMIDGIPAYAQCTSSQNSPIFSNNGVDTSFTRTGSDWVETQYDGGYQCTELAHRYLYFKWQVKWLPNGNAGVWCDTTPPANSGVVQTMVPMHGDLMVLAPGSCGADTTYGHVNVVDVVDSTGKKVTAVEQNQAGRNTYMATCAKCFLHVMANNGTPTPIAGGSAAGSAASQAGSGGYGGSTTVVTVTPPPTNASAGAGGGIAPTGVSSMPITQPTNPPIAGSASTSTLPPSAAGSAAPGMLPLTEPVGGAPAITSENRDAASGTSGGCAVARVATGRFSDTLSLFGFGLAALLVRRRSRRRAQA